MPDTPIKRGLEGVVVTESDLSYIDGIKGILIYRGYSIEELAEKSSFEEVLYLLWNGTLPDSKSLTEFSDNLKNNRELPDGVLQTIVELANQDETPMAALRTIVSMLSGYESNVESPIDPTLVLQQGIHITAKMPTILAAFDRARNGEKIIPPRKDLSHAANFLYMLTASEPDETKTNTLDTALILHCDHGINASTFAARVTVSTLSDIHSAITSAIGTLAGPLHGGANQRVMMMLLEIDASNSDPITWVKKQLEKGKKIPGFGHRVYKTKDPRATILGAMSEELGTAAGDSRWHEYSVSIEDYLDQEKRLASNVDFYSASAYYQMGIPIDLYTPIFALSRIGGWVGHVIEQYSENRLIRPRANYTGPLDSKYIPIDQR
ncbi:citrate synthase [Candidatus Hikarchaeum yamanae]|uniref:citrate synthase n=1 Tax=Candidatus Hikarchaeum yamanae TaxID=2675326 RepID=UPI0039ED3353